MRLVYQLLLSFLFCKIHSARILIYVWTPSLSHQIIYHPIISQLLKEGHKVTYVTTNPIYTGGKAPDNFTEIDISRSSYETWTKHFKMPEFGKENFISKGTRAILEVVPKIFGVQMKNEPVKALLKDTFDLIISESWQRMTSIFSHIFKAPALKLSSMSLAYGNAEAMGIPINPVLYPTCFQQKLYNLTLREQIIEIYNYFYITTSYNSYINEESDIIQEVFGDVPHLRDMEQSMDALLLNVNPMWDKNRPLPMTVGYVGNIHKTTPKDLPKDLQSYLDSSKNGVIYMSFGTNVPPSKLAPQLIRMFASVFKELPYNVLWKWDLDDVEGMPSNVRTARWFPQADVFRHPNMKLVITQGGLQTTEEAIECGLPLIGIPFLADQWLNVDNYVHHGLGKYLDVERVNADEFKAAIVEVIENESYRARVSRFRALVLDRPVSPTQLVSWWTARLLRHGAGFMRAPAADMSYLDYLQLEGVLLVLFCCLCVSVAMTTTTVVILKLSLNYFDSLAIARDVVCVNAMYSAIIIYQQLYLLN